MCGSDGVECTWLEIGGVQSHPSRLIRRHGVVTKPTGIDDLPSLTPQLTFKLSLLPHAMEDMGAHVQAKLNGLLMK